MALMAADGSASSAQGASAQPAGSEAPLMARWAVGAASGTGTAALSTLAMDKAGNVYATGVLQGEVAFGKGVSLKGPGDTWNAILVKYSPAGQALWARSITGGTGLSVYSSVAVDTTGNAYAVGFISTGKWSLGADVQATGVFSGNGGANMIVAKYDPRGKPLWARTLPKAQGDSDLSSVAVDRTGCVYAAGSIGMTAAGPLEISNKASSFTAYPAVRPEYRSGLLLKYDPSGTVLWVRGTKSHSDFRHVSIDPEGNVVTVGDAWGTGYDFGNGVSVKAASLLLLAKYDPSGKALLARSTVASTGDMMLSQVFSDGTGATYAVFDFQFGKSSEHFINFGGGVSVNASPGGGNAALVKYDAAGKPAWAVMIADRPLTRHALAADAATVYVSGEVAAGPLEESIGFGNGVVGRAVGTWGTVGFLTGFDASSGRARWVVAPLAQGDGMASLDCLLPVAKTGLLVSGRLRGEAPADFGAGVTARNPSTSEGPALVMYDAAAAVGPASDTTGQAFVGTAASDAAGASAESWRTGGFDPAAGLGADTPIIHGAAGSPLAARWARCFNKGADGSTLTAAASDPAGNVLAVGMVYGGRAYDLGDGVTIPPAPVDSILLAKYSADGKALWARTVSKAAATSRFDGVAVDESGTVYAVGTVETGRLELGPGVSVDVKAYKARILASYDPAGRVKWARSFETDGQHSGLTVVAARAGALYVTASGSLMRLDDSGKSLWTAAARLERGACDFTSLIIDGAGNACVMGSIPRAVRVDFGNNVSASVSGYSCGEVIVKYDASGTAQWATAFSCEYPLMHLTGVDADGNIYAAGYVKGMHPYDFGRGVAVGGTTETNARQVLVVVKYDPSGTPLWERNLESASGLFDYRAAALSGPHLYVAGAVFTREGEIGYATGDQLVELVASYDLSGRLEWVAMPPWESGRERIAFLAPTGSGGLLMIAALGPFGGMDLGDGVIADGMDEIALIRFDARGLPAGAD
jgi:hypothetical protein